MMPDPTTRYYAITECVHGSEGPHREGGASMQAFLAGLDPDDKRFDCPGGSRTLLTGRVVDLEAAAKALFHRVTNRTLNTTDPMAGVWRRDAEAAVDAALGGSEVLLLKADQ